MKLNDLKPAEGAKKNRRRVGRGLGSGRGKTAGRGQKGQKSRSGFSQGSGWEGGRSKLVARLPKRGFNHATEGYQLVNLRDLNRFGEGDTINAETLNAVGLVRHADRPVKLLGDGALEVRNLVVILDAYSRSAAKAVRAAGGSVEGADVGGAEAEEVSSQTANIQNLGTQNSGTQNVVQPVGTAEQTMTPNTAPEVDGSESQSTARVTPEGTVERTGTGDETQAVSTIQETVQGTSQDSSQDTSQDAVPDTEEDLQEDTPRNALQDAQQDEERG